MGFSHIFYKKLPLDDGNTFSANLVENDGIEGVLLKKDRECMVTGLSINQKAVTDIRDGKLSFLDVMFSVKKGSL